MARKDDDVYLGDGLYASTDGYYITVTAERGGRTHEVMFDPQSLTNLVGFADRTWGRAEGSGS